MLTRDLLALFIQQYAKISTDTERRYDWRPKFENASCDPDNAHYGVVCRSKANTWYILLFTKFDDSSFSRTRDIIGVPKILMFHVTW